MIALALVGLVLAVAGLVIHLERKDTRHGEAVQYLLQRIQDPQAAVVQHAVATTQQMPVHLPFDDDEAWLSYVENLSGSTD